MGGDEVNEHRHFAAPSGGAAASRLDRRHFLERGVVGGLATAGAGLLAACSQAPAASPAATAVKPAEAAKPAEVAQPAPAAPAAQPAGAVAPAAGKPVAAGSVTLVMDVEPRTMENWHAYS